MTLLLAEGVSVLYGGVHALRHVVLRVERGQTLALIGRSGSGKTTLLHVLAGLVRPTAGSLERHGTTAIVFQNANLLPQLTAIENVRFAAADGVDAEQLLGLVGLDSKLDHLPRELSGGEAQRVAIARALAQAPDVLLCDEPTGHLDSDTSGRVLDLVAALRERFGFALVVATHDPEVAGRCERIVQVADGELE